MKSKKHPERLRGMRGEISIKYKVKNITKEEKGGPPQLCIL